MVILNHDSKGTQKDRENWENSMYNSCHFKSSLSGGMVVVWNSTSAKVMEETVRECLQRRREDQRKSYKNLLTFFFILIKTQTKGMVTRRVGVEKVKGNIVGNIVINSHDDR